MKKKSNKTPKILAIGAGALALAASSHYLFGPKGKSHRKLLNGWMIKMKGEIIEKLESAGEVSESVYHEIIDSVLKTYISTGKIAEPELRRYSEILKSQWKNIVKLLPKSKSKSIKIKKF